MTEGITEDSEFIEEYECENCGETFIAGKKRQTKLCEACLQED